eukprot:scaffold39330_cov61-Cyclotella_meneghiniana.AAC.6
MFNAHNLIKESFAHNDGTTMTPMMRQNQITTVPTSLQLQSFFSAALFMEAHQDSWQQVALALVSLSLFYWTKQKLGLGAQCAHDLLSCLGGKIIST